MSIAIKLCDLLTIDELFEVLQDLGERETRDEKFQCAMPLRTIVNSLISHYVFEQKSRAAKIPKKVYRSKRLTGRRFLVSRSIKYLPYTLHIYIYTRARTRAHVHTHARVGLKGKTIFAILRVERKKRTKVKKKYEDALWACMCMGLCVPAREYVCVYVHRALAHVCVYVYVCVVCIRSLV